MNFRRLQDTDGYILIQLRIALKPLKAKPACRQRTEEVQAAVKPALMALARNGHVVKTRIGMCLEVWDTL